jgi:hypothetical protein
MNKTEAIELVCSIVSLAYHSVGDYTEPSDGFCTRCESMGCGTLNYQNGGKAIDYVRAAVVRALKEDGYTIAKGFDADTGKEK